MTAPVSIGPKGRDFARTVIARALSMRDAYDPIAVASQRWGPRVADLTKAAVGTSGAGMVDYNSAQREFFSRVMEQSIVGRLPGLRRVPIAVRTITPTTSTSAGWVKRGSAAPVVRMGFTAETLPPLKVVAVAALTVETLRDSSPKAEEIVRQDLARAVVDVLDATFIDPNNAGVTDEKPASVTNGVTPVSGGDLKALVADFAGDLTQASFVGHPTTFAGLSGATHPDVGLRGGGLLGAPAFASRNVQPINSPAEFPLALIDASGIALAEGEIDVRVITEGDILLDSDPAMSTSPPSGAEMVSLWQTNTVAVMITKSINWSVFRSGSVSVLTGV